MSDVAPTGAATSGRVRAYATLRTAQLERLRGMVPARVLYTDTRYDFDEAAVELDPTPERVTDRQILGELARGELDAVEVNEPAMVARWPVLIAQVLAARWGGLRRRRRVALVSYAISNADPVAKVIGRWRLPEPVARVLTRAVMWFLVVSLDRLAFGTEGAAENYRRRAGRRVVGRRSRTFEALPAPCDCPPVDAPDRPDRVLFVGAFADRKGILPLLAAWEVLNAEDPSARLVLMGTGPRTTEVLEWARRRAEVEVHVDAPRADIHRALRRSGVLVLWSQPAPQWREQIGLPILEGLAHGCEVVATTETGLATWLSDLGHEVLAPDSGPRALAAAINRARVRQAGRGGTLGALPGEDQRLTADRWLFLGAR